MLNHISRLFIVSFIAFIAISFTHGANIYLQPEQDTLISNCPNNIDIMIDTQWAEIFWAWINMMYDWKNIEIVWFYLNEDLNIPLNLPKSTDMWNFKNTALSIIRDDNFHHVGFTWLFKYATLVIKNRSELSDTRIDFLFSWQGSTIDNMDVFRIEDARDILSNVEWKTFVFSSWTCSHLAPNGIDQMNNTYDINEQLYKNLQNIANLEKMYWYKAFFLRYWSYMLLILLLLLATWIMYKKWMLKDIKLLKHKQNQNA